MCCEPEAGAWVVENMSWLSPEGRIWMLYVLFVAKGKGVNAAPSLSMLLLPLLPVGVTPGPCQGARPPPLR